MAHPRRGESACRRLGDGTAIYVVGTGEPRVRLDCFLKERIPKLSRRRIQLAIRQRVEAPGHLRPKPATLLRPGDTVIVRRAEPREEAEPAIRVPILYRDDDILVIDKPAGLLSHPSNHARKGSVAYLLGRDVGGRCHLAHRLDRETSGVMLAARTVEAARRLSAQLSRHAEGVSKCYLAVVFGDLSVVEGVIDLPIGRAARSAVYVKRGVDHREGRRALTRYRVEARCGRFTLVRAWLQTGRRHQIRVHLAAIGHPVVGDKLYGRSEGHYLRFIRSGFDETMRAELLVDRHLLHAAEIAFLHPRDGRPMRFTTPPPADMRDFLAANGLRATE